MEGEEDTQINVPQQQRIRAEGQESSMPSEAKGSESRADWADLYRKQHTASSYERRFRGPIKSLNNRFVWRTLWKELYFLREELGPEILVMDAPAGTGRFTQALRKKEIRVLHLDRSREMLKVLQGQHGEHLEVVGDLRSPPLQFANQGVVICFRLMQHLSRKERMEALRGLRLLAPFALVAYYPGWHYKDKVRRLRHRLGLPHRTLREKLSLAQIREEVEQAGWELKGWRRVMPLLSENVLLRLG